MNNQLPSSRIVWPLAVLLGSLLVLSSTPVRARQEKPQGKAWLGVAIRDVSDSEAKKNNLSENRGALVSDFPEDSPAETAGIKKGDVIVEFNRKQIDDADALAETVGKMNVGDKADVVVLRKGEKKSFQVTLGKAPRVRELGLTIRRPANIAWAFGNHTTQGMQLMELNDQLSEYFGVPGGTGVLVEKVEKESPAAKAGIKAGDVLQKIGKRSIDDLRDVTKALERAEDGDKLTVDVLRKGESKTFTLEVEEDASTGRMNIFRYMPDAGTFRVPEFEGRMFDERGLNDHQFRLEWDDLRPQMDQLKERITDMTRKLRDHRLQLERTVRLSKIRSV